MPLVGMGRVMGSCRASQVMGGWAACFSEEAPEVSRPGRDGVKGWNLARFSSSAEQTVPGVTRGSMRSEFSGAQRRDSVSL